MAGAAARVPMSYRILTSERSEILEGFSGPAMSLSDTVFGFLEEDSEGSPEGCCRERYGEDDEHDDEEEDEVEEKEKLGSGEDNKSFWKNQHELLNATLCRTSSIETRIRNIAKETVKDNKEVGGEVCGCRRPVSGGCRSCLMRELCGRLQNAGFDSAICKSKWRNSPDIPSGEHTFLDVIDRTSSKKGEVRVIIELNFRAEFEMARASQEYNKLISRLPEVFVGKLERLLTLIKILCSAAKKCMKENKMHMGPWRKQKYMQAKWLRTFERKASSPPPVAGYSSRTPPRRRPRASMLTVGLLENFPNLHHTAVEVV